MVHMKDVCLLFLVQRHVTGNPYVTQYVLRKSHEVPRCLAADLVIKVFMSIMASSHVQSSILIRHWNVLLGTEAM